MTSKRSRDQVAGPPWVNAEPGKEAQIQFKALNQGLFVYRSSTAAPSSVEHVLHGMYGLILVEPAGGLKPVEKEFYVHAERILHERWQEG